MVWCQCGSYFPRQLYCCFFFQAEDGIRDLYVTGVQTCALPIWAHGFAPRQLPVARRVAERLGGERADRAQVDDVSGELGVHRLADESDDLGVLAAPDHAELHDAADLLAEAHAARAVDAARHVGRDERTQALVQHHALLFGVARGALAVADREVLELAFAALVADRAVERMVDEQELHHAVLRVPRVVGARKHFHAFADRRGASGLGLGRL